MSHPLSDRFHELLRELGDLHDQKQADYGKDDDPFANVRGAQEWGVEPWVGAMIRLTDKVRRLQSYVRKGSLANEGVEDSLKDMAVYSLIALVLWEKRENSKAGKPEPSMWICHVDNTKSHFEGKPCDICDKTRTEDQPRRGECPTCGECMDGIGHSTSQCNVGIGPSPKWWNYTDEKVPF